MTDAVSLVARVDTRLGEGPCWDEASGRLYWVDMLSNTLHFWSAGRDPAHMKLPIGASALGVRRAGGLIMVGDRQAGVVDVENAAFEPRLTFDDDRPNNRSNDGAVGHDGRFWFGTMDGQVAHGRGRLYSLDTSWKLTQVGDGISIPNAIRTTAGGKRLYSADTSAQAVYIHDLDPGTGALSPPRVFAQMQLPARSGPDGAALDEEGCLWLAVWRAGRGGRFTPNGEIDREIPLPVSLTTSVVFGGPDHKTLFVTSANFLLDEKARAAEPLAGSIFAIDADVRGLEVPVFAG
jgi:sugar lactone lactonase YvrE